MLWKCSFDTSAGLQGPCRRITCACARPWVAAAMPRARDLAEVRRAAAVACPGWGRRPAAWTSSPGCCVMRRRGFGRTFRAGLGLAAATSLAFDLMVLRTED